MKRNELNQYIQSQNVHPKLLPGAKTVLAGITFTAVVLLVCSALRIQLGLPTLATGIIISSIVFFRSGKNPFHVIRKISWAILPLVACLFIIVEALTKTGIIQHISFFLQKTTVESTASAVWISGLASAYGSNILNNLPAGLIMGNVTNLDHFPEIVKRAILIGTDLGPNLSVTGSLATILWITVLRREGLKVTSWQFFKIGLLIMSVTLFFVLASLFI